MITAGTPCQDNGTLKGGAWQGLTGEQSSLFWEATRVLSTIRAMATTSIQVEMVVEDVTGVSPEDCALMPVSLQARGQYLLDANESQPCPEAETMVADMAPDSHREGETGTQQNTPPVHRMGEKRPSTLANAMEDANGGRPTTLGGGMRPSTTAQARIRWREGNHRDQVHQYEDRGVLWNGLQHRMLTSKEREALMGFHRGAPRDSQSTPESNWSGTPFTPRSLV